MVPRERSYHMIYQSCSTHCSKFISKVKVLKKRVKLQGQGHRNKNNSTLERFYHRKYSKDISKVQVFKQMGQTPRSRSNGEKNGTHGKILSQGILIWNIKAVALTVQKLLAKLNFFKKWVKLQGHRNKNNSTFGKVLSQKILKSY